MTRASRATTLVRIQISGALVGVAMQTLLPKGHVSCLSGSFKYTPAVKTDVAQTFARVRLQLEARTPSNVRDLQPRKAGEWARPA
jgi:hypothetical protein